ncbi:hypothetical protein Vadar_030050 [Vaccinium darrowii]|uniref:Uncharacterized protein n=1 Tax=Vaccinium darrowii TaxID=229202 RepID=A0ACB7Z7J3_9ERIC|nr:hypothetical protein Vadar_030050 [Vaccinium darrowii]
MLQLHFHIETSTPAMIYHNYRHISTGSLEPILATPKFEIANQTPQWRIVWAIDPANTGMISWLFRNANGSITFYPTTKPSYNPSMLLGALSFRVPNTSVVSTVFRRFDGHTERRNNCESHVASWEFCFEKYSSDAFDIQRKYSINGRLRFSVRLLIWHVRA